MRVPVRRGVAIAAILTAFVAGSASAMDLAQTLAAARAHNPVTALAEAEAEAATARQRRARAAQGPSAALNGMIADGRSDLGGFFGFGRENITPSSLSLEVVQPLFTSGALSAGLAGAQADRRRAQALAERAAAEAELETARAEFVRIVGQAPIDLSPLPVPPAPAETFDDFLIRAAAESPEVKAAEQAEAAAVAGLRAARAAFGPTVALSAQASQVRDQFLPGYSNDEWRVGVQGRWVLFDSGSTSASVAERSAGVRAAQARLRAARDGVEAQTLSAWHAAHAAQLRRTAVQASYDAAALAAASVAEEVAAGQRPLVDRLDAETRLADAERARSEADAAVLIVACRLRAVVGDAGCGGVFADPA